ncbi:hypothetical protein GE061_013361 [Apolygus lucorum]|uniref:Uncharacterized protein n=1 Tax=Apolygus lucorum TaxID=248454 RepID=A0A8S9XMS0_APOLU|nr:hypothetical protein GE061_013361 [Apolygus lucorum]
MADNRKYSSGALKRKMKLEKEQQLDKLKAKSKLTRYFKPSSPTGDQEVTGAGIPGTSAPLEALGPYTFSSHGPNSAIPEKAQAEPPVSAQVSGELAIPSSSIPPMSDCATPESPPHLVIHPSSEGLALPEIALIPLWIFMDGNDHLLSPHPLTMPTPSMGTFFDLLDMIVFKGTAVHPLNGIGPLIPLWISPSLGPARSKSLMVMQEMPQKHPI